MKSLHSRLLFVLLGGTAVLWLVAVLWIKVTTLSEIESVLDERMVEAANMVASLAAQSGIGNGNGPGRAAEMLQSTPASADSHYLRHLSCQIWAMDETMVGSTDMAPTQSLGGNEPGFSETVIDGERWRVFTVVNAEEGFRVMVGDRVGRRGELVGGLVLAILLPAMLVLPGLGVLIWLTIKGGLRPLDKLAGELKRRPALDLDPVTNTGSVRELDTIVSALNGLFARLRYARDSEISFTAFAAHELKTPLAVLRTQAQIVLLARDEATRDQAIQGIEHGIHRTDRIVRQLLDLSMADAVGVSAPLEVAVPMADILAGQAAELEPQLTARDVRVAIDAGKTSWPDLAGGEALLATAIRNLLENAVHASAPGGEVAVSVDREQEGWRIDVTDQGAGIPDDERDRVTERFFRGKSSGAGGTGLGLSIVVAAMERLGGELILGAKTDGGTCASLRLPQRVFATTPSDQLAA